MLPIPIAIQSPYPGASAALGNLATYFIALQDLLIVGVSAAPSADETSGTIDIDDDGTNVISAVDASDQNVPGTWKTKGFGGTNDPVRIAAGSKVSIDFNSFSNGIQALVVLYVLPGATTT